MKELSQSWTRVLLVLVAACLSLPFLFQPFHIDDRIYLEIADRALEDPLFPYDYAPVFEGLVTQDAASHSHLPLTSYYLAIVKWVTGSQSEWVFHLAFLVFPLMLVLGFYDLARRYSSFPAAAAFLLIVTPGVLVLSHTLMTEVPLLAFWTMALSRFLRILDGSARRHDVWICALSLVAAAFISLLGAALVLLLGAVLLMKWLEGGRSDSLDGWSVRLLDFWGTPKFRMALLLLVLPLLVWIIWYLRALFHYDRFVLVRTFQHLDKRAAFSLLLVGRKLLTFVLNLGGAALFPLVVWLAFAGKRRGLVSLLVGIVGGIFAWFQVSSDWTVKETLLLAALLSTGTLLLLSVVIELWPSWRNWEARDTGKTVLLLWFLGILAANVLLYPSGSVRYMLLALPPACLAWMMSMERLQVNPYFRRNLIWASAVLTVSYSLVVGHADFRLASMYRNLAHDIVRDYGKEGRQIWFTAEWGLRYYLEQSGAKLLLRTGTGARPGDIIVKPYVASPWVTLYDSNEYLSLLEQREAEMGSRLRILDHYSHAGFYSTAWGILPFSFGREERWEWVNVFQVKKQYDGPIPEPELHY